MVWVLVIGFAVYAIRLRPGKHSVRKTGAFIIGGGVLLPTVTLTALLAYGLSMLPELVEPAPEGSLTVKVSGEQWWWRVEYIGPEGQAVELANEIRLPVDQPVQFHLDSPDVVHSFWIPALGPKMDMIPGRVNRLVLHPTRTGVFRGVCAEFCGASHALMAFDVVVMEPKAFDQWLAAQAQPAAPATAGSPAEEGYASFLRNGCGACHTVRGTLADGELGPDLTHVASRLSLAASVLPNEPAAYRRFISHAKEVKPEANMPRFGMLPEDEIVALVAYLESLE